MSSWTEYLAKWRKAHPDVKGPDVMRKAAVEYKKQKPAKEEKPKKEKVVKEKVVKEMKPKKGKKEEVVEE
jgi:hypothetical protein